jgi:cytochrome b subunit of formate dehydrogenase
MGQIVALLQRYNRAIHYLSIATGVLLVLMGVMLFTGSLERLARFAPLIPYLGF